jgi:AcrR family transcriptional regulator
MPRPHVPLLSRDAIVERALAIIDSDGIDGLSMRKLAADLGVSGASLYHHFASKDQILDEIIKQIYARIRLDEADGDWEGLLTGYARQLRALLSEHPHVVEYLALHLVTSEAQLRIYEHFAEQFSRCGWTMEFGREVTLAVENLVHGAALMANAPDLDLTSEQQQRYPLLAQLRRVERRKPDDGFEVGFEALIAGLRTLAPG